MSAIVQRRNPGNSTTPTTGCKGGERIGRHLRLRGRDFPDQRGLARIRKTNQAGVGDAAELHVENPVLAGRAERVLGRRPVGRGFEIPVARAGLAALAEHEFLPDLGEVGDGLQVDALAHRAPTRRHPARCPRSPGRSRSPAAPDRSRACRSCRSCARRRRFSRPRR